MDINNQHPLFKERSFDNACRTVVGDCNNIPFAVRWEQETPLFAEAILRFYEGKEGRIVDYGVGVGRIAKAIMEGNSEVNLIGIDDSPIQLEHARRYINSDRFRALLPEQLNETVDLVYSVYVLQHIPAIVLRSSLERIHNFLRKDGVVIFCSSNIRMVPRFNESNRQFFDDRVLGVNLKTEVERLFDPLGDLFTKEDLDSNEVVRKMVNGDDGRKIPYPDGSYGIAHPAIVYRKKEVQCPYFNLPMP